MKLRLQTLLPGGCRPPSPLRPATCQLRPFSKRKKSTAPKEVLIETASASALLGPHQEN